MNAVASAHLDRSIVEQQLERILASSQFVDTTRLNRFLRYLVEQALVGNSEALKGYTIGLDVFDKAEDFDPAIDTIVRVQAGKLRSRLDLYYAQDGKDDPLRIMVPKGSYAPVFEVAFDPDVEAQGAEESSTRPLNVADPIGTMQKYSIAVLPFDNLSGDPNQEFLADGLTEEILNALTRFREFKVISRHSTFRYKDTQVDPRDIGTELGVRYILEGSVRRWRDQVRVTAQLIETGSGTHLTSEVYDREISAQNLFDIQEDIASRIAAEIAEPHGVIHRTGKASRQAGTQALDAYECRLLATEYWRNPTQEAHARVTKLLERAVSIDPGYAGAWAMLGIVYGDEIRGNYPPRDDRPSLDRALEAAQRAIEIDPMNAAGHHALFVTHYHRGEFAAYKSAARRAIALNPNYPDLLADYGFCHGFSENWREGREYVQKAMDLSPHPPGWYRAFLAIYHYVHNDYEAALAQTEAVELGAFFWGDLIHAMIHAQLGNDGSARESMDAALRAFPQFGSQARQALKFWHFRENDMAHLIDGWQRAGLSIED